jgi:5,10-methenyltetrahydrofolate synthetase
MTAQGAKAEMRKAILAQRAALSQPAWQAANRAISKQVLALGAYRDAQTVLAYMSIAAEFDSSEIVRTAIADDKVLVLPKINKSNNRLDLFRVSNIDADLIPGPWGILEPNAQRCEKISPDEVDFVLVPGLAFDADCRRLGYGAGYYDRLLEDLGPFATFVAAAFALQIVERVPVEAHDISLDVVVTENQKYTCNRSVNHQR